MVNLQVCTTHNNGTARKIWPIDFVKTFFFRKMEVTPI